MKKLKFYEAEIVILQSWEFLLSFADS